MPSPSDTVETIDIDTVWAKLSIAYGHRFLSIWDGLPMDTVKADWEHELAAVSQDQLAYGLTNLPGGRPPDVFQFRDICRRMPEKPRQQSLPDMAPRKIPEILRPAIERILAPKPKTGEPLRVAWARRYVEQFGGQGLRLRNSQRENLTVARRILELHERSKGLDAAKAEAAAKTKAALAQQEQGA